MNYDPGVAASPAGLGRDEGRGPAGRALYRLTTESRNPNDHSDTLLGTPWKSQNDGLRRTVVTRGCELGGIGESAPEESVANVGSLRKVFLIVGQEAEPGGVGAPWQL